MRPDARAARALLFIIKLHAFFIVSFPPARLMGSWHPTLRAGRNAVVLRMGSGSIHHREQFVTSAWPLRLSVLVSLHCCEGGVAGPAGRLSLSFVGFSEREPEQPMRGFWQFPSAPWRVVTLPMIPHVDPRLVQPAVRVPACVPFGHLLSNWLAVLAVPQAVRPGLSFGTPNRPPWCGAGEHGLLFLCIVHLRDDVAGWKTTADAIQ